MTVRMTANSTTKKEPVALPGSDLLMSMTELAFEELVNLKDYMEQLITQKKKEQQKQLNTNMLELAKAAGFTSVEDFLQTQKGRMPRRDKGVKIPPKYQNKDGDKTWSGKGRSPNWVKTHIADGGELADLLI